MSTEGSYGGYLTAMALGRDSELFSGGVDIHGVHDRTLYGYLNSINYEKAPDYDLARRNCMEIISSCRCRYLEISCINYSC